MFLKLEASAVSFFHGRLFGSLGAKAFLLGVKASVMEKFQMFMELVKKFRFNNLGQEEGTLSVICNIGTIIRSERNYRCFSNKIDNEETFLQSIE